MLGALVIPAEAGTSGQEVSAGLPGAPAFARLTEGAAALASVSA
jgi:hypothetical protein